MPKSLKGLSLAQRKDDIIASDTAKIDKCSAANDVTLAKRDALTAPGGKDARVAALIATGMQAGLAPSMATRLANDSYCDELHDAELALKRTQQALKEAREKLINDLKGEEIGWAQDVVWRLGDAIKTNAVGRISDIELRALLAAEDAEAPAEVIPKPSELVDTAIMQLVQSKYAAHAAWLAYEQQCTTLRATLTALPRRDIEATCQATLAAIDQKRTGAKSGQIAGPYDNQAGLLMKLATEYVEAHGLARVPAEVFPTIEAEAVKQWAAKMAPFDAQMQAAKDKRNQQLEALDATPLAVLVDRHAVEAREMLEQQANAAAAQAEQAYLKLPPAEQQRRMLAGSGGSAKTAEELTKLAIGKLAAELYEKVMGVAINPITLPVAPTSERPANLERYKGLLDFTTPAAPTLAAVPVIDNRIPSPRRKAG